MKVAVVDVQVPFVRGGAELLADWLTATLRARGFETESIRIPFSWWPGTRVLDSLLAARLIRLDGVDRVIALKFPAYCVPHDDKVLWVLHQFRQVYDLWGTPLQDLPDTPEGRGVRDAVIRADNTFLREAKRLYTNSSVVAGRLKRHNGIEAEVLYPPLLEPERYRPGPYGDYVFYPSRISPAKRQELAVEAMRHVRTGVRLVVAGHGDTPRELDRLMAAAARQRLTGQVEVIGRWISDDEKAALMANALGCVYIPYDEDSYGFVTLESYQARKPVVTCTDSGGTLKLVEDGVTGCVVPPDPVELAGALDRLMADRARARAMGEAGYERMRALNISWDRVVEALTR